MREQSFARSADSYEFILLLTHLPGDIVGDRPLPLLLFKAVFGTRYLQTFLIFPIQSSPDDAALPPSTLSSWNERVERLRLIHGQYAKVMHLVQRPQFERR